MMATADDATRMGEAYEALGENTLAIAAYEKAVSVDKGQVNAIGRIRVLRTSAAK